MTEPSNYGEWLEWLKYAQRPIVHDKEFYSPKSKRAYPANRKPKYSVYFKLVKDGGGKTVCYIDSLDDGSNNIGFKKYEEISELMKDY